MIRFIDATTGAPQVMGRFRPDRSEETLFLTRDARGPSLEDRSPKSLPRTSVLTVANARKRTAQRRLGDRICTLEYWQACWISLMKP